jgi:hypothetical protein
MAACSRRCEPPPGAAEGVEVQITYSQCPRPVPDWTDRPSAATYDLHSQVVSEASANAERFLRAQGRVRPGGVVRLITGRGRGGGGAPVRTRVRTLLRRLRDEGTVVRDYILEDSEGSFLVRLR